MDWSMKWRWKLWHGLNHETEAKVDDMDEIEWKDVITLDGQVLSLWCGGGVLGKPQLFVCNKLACAN
jgi:hypothetical protein